MSARMSGGNDLTREDIVLVIQSPFQNGMLKIFGASGVCYDSTHGYHGIVKDFLLYGLSQIMKTLRQCVPFAAKSRTTLEPLKPFI